MNDRDDAPKIIQPPSTLKLKVGPPSAGGIDLEALERAEKLIAGMADSYLDWVNEDLVKVQTAFDNLKKAPLEDRAEAADKVFGVAHDIKGQGGSFNYPLMTMIGNMLCRFIEGLEGNVGDKDLDVINLHIQALKMVIARKLDGDGGKEGERLMRGLELVHAKKASK